MMKNPKIALFRPHEAEEEVITSLFRRAEYSLYQADLPADLLNMQEELDLKFDCAIIPMRLNSGVNGISTLLQMKSVEELAPIPIIALSATKDSAIIEALYGAGADCVLLQPIDPNHLFFQICALARQRQAFDEQVQQKYESSGLRLSTITAFNCVREGIIIFDTKLDPVFINSAGVSMLGLATGGSSQELRTISEQLIPLLHKFSQSQRNLVSQTDSGSEIGSYETPLTRADNHIFQSSIHITELKGAGVSSAGFAASITDLSEPLQLSSMLVQAERTRALCLICAAGSRRLFKDGALGEPTSPLKYLDQLLGQETAICNVGDSLTALLEIVDLVINPEVVVKVKIDSSVKIAVRSSDFLQLLGLMILQAVEFAGPGGETEISAEESSSHPDYLSLLVTAQSKRVTPLLPNDYLANILKGDYSIHTDNDYVGDNEQDQKLPYGLQAAQNIADNYKTDVELARSSESRMKIRVQLPLVS